jgi:hypothetical protein
MASGPLRQEYRRRPLAQVPPAGRELPELRALPREQRRSRQALQGERGLRAVRVETMRDRWCRWSELWPPDA